MALGSSNIPIKCSIMPSLHAIILSPHGGWAAGLPTPCQSAKN